LAQKSIAELIAFIGLMRKRNRQRIAAHARRLRRQLLHNLGGTGACFCTAEAHYRDSVEPESGEVMPDDQEEIRNGRWA
jgi:hypothetical protein